MYIKLSSLYPNKTLIEINEAILGKWLGKFVSLLFVASTLLFCSQVLFYAGSFLTTRIIIQTPMLAVHILFMGIVIVGVRLGIETIARCAEILFPWFVIPFLILVFSIFPQIHYENLQPLLEVGVKPIIRSILVFTSITSLTIIAVTFSLIVYLSIPYEQTWDRDTWIPYSLLFGLFYPLGLLIVGKIRVKHSASLSK